MRQPRAWFGLALGFFAVCALGAVPSCDDPCSDLDTGCDGARAVTCDVTLCLVGPCPRVLVEEECADDERCIVNDDAGFPRARCIADANAAPAG